ncbi:hypothetical protein PPACK8108_LOCUS137 [Phakopsora pachyrhizi]|uniref:Uncharacterized protein n=1 Tax=Phakopsora pachyrhizi TaxID=170000 RepID=A0AAV0AFR9_PHAPC|nr:hypothetical protein PPACK8108_LOCUS137 [Phakopsora pachyrhizi]
MSMAARKFQFPMDLSTQNPVDLNTTSRPSPLQLRFITPPKTILTIELKTLRLNSLSISELVFHPVIISNQLVRPTDRSSTRMFLSNLTSLTLTLNSTSNFHDQQLYLRQPKDGTDDDFVNDEEINCDPIDPEYILGSPNSEMVRYSHPQFFITDEPESSPFYLNPTIWILAFLCQRSQGFTIPRICDLSKFVRKATSIMLTMTPMIHLLTFKTLMISIHLGYALSIAGAAADPSQQAIAFTEKSLSYKRPYQGSHMIQN